MMKNQINEHKQLVTRGYLFRKLDAAMNLKKLASSTWRVT